MVVENIKENHPFCSNQLSYQPLPLHLLLNSNLFTLSCQVFVKRIWEAWKWLSALQRVSTLPLNAGSADCLSELGKRHGFSVRLLMSMEHDSLSCNVLSSRWDKALALRLLDACAFLYSFI